MAQDEKTTEAAIDLGRIEAIRAASNDTRKVVREMASYLFLECGVYPSANRILSLAKRGSMVTITNELENWWDILRKRARPLLAAPDLPDSLRDKLAEFGSELWITANDAARTNFEAARTQLEELAQSANRRAEDAALQAQSLKAELAAAHEDKHALHLRLEQRDDALAQAEKASAMLRNEVERRTQENKETQERLVTAQAEFSKELDKQRETIEKIEQRAAADLRHQHLEVDRARQETLRKAAELAKAKDDLERVTAAAQAAQQAAAQTAAQLRQQLTQLASERAVSEAALKSAVASLETQLGSKSELLGAAKLSQQSAEAREKETSAELRALRATLDRVLEERAALQAELATPSAEGAPKRGPTSPKA
jgi:DNA repair exonuclease SbcCD ATPase subunit